MTDDGKLTYTEVLCGIAALAEEVSRLHILEAALKAVQEGKDYRPTLKRLSDYTRFQASGNPSEQQISEMEELRLHNLKLFVEAQQNERGREPT